MEQKKRKFVGPVLLQGKTMLVHLFVPPKGDGADLQGCVSVKAVVLLTGATLGWPRAD